MVASAAFVHAWAARRGFSTPYAPALLLKRAAGRMACKVWRPPRNRDWRAGAMGGKLPCLDWVGD